MQNEALLEKLGKKFESLLETIEDKPIETIFKTLILYVVFKQLFGGKKTA